ncbi:MAG TPA: hypothetical protein VJ776_03255, partial [Thermoanaerobaculia bacterium]|nr:hypothetical protein [Thermoanaerobaculia bacterium]
WTPARAGLETASVLAFALDRRSGVLYAGADRGVFASPDGGATWTPLNAGLINLTINALVLDPVSGLLYAGSNGASVFRLASAAPARPPIEDSRRHPPPRQVNPRS